MSYSRNFGMRSFENIVRDGRHRAPVAPATPLLIGGSIKVDTANPGFIAIADVGDGPSQLCGIALFEHIQFQGVDTTLVSNHDAPFNQVPPGRYVQMVHGQGAKVWFKNTGDKPLYDGRVQQGVDLITGDFPAVGDALVPDGTGLWEVSVESAPGADDAPAGWLIVEQVNPSTGLVEARLNF